MIGNRGEPINTPHADKFFAPFKVYATCHVHFQSGRLQSWETVGTMYLPMMLSSEGHLPSWRLARERGRNAVPQVHIVKCAILAVRSRIFFSHSRASMFYRSGPVRSPVIRISDTVSLAHNQQQLHHANVHLHVQQEVATQSLREYHIQIP